MGPTHTPTLVRISELARLAGVPAPTIKHYMREGLLPRPRFRTSRNMAYYDASLAERVRAIKNLQQTRFLPLRVIEQILEPAPSAELRSDLTQAERAELGLNGAEPEPPPSGVHEPADVQADESDAQRLVGAGLLDGTENLGPAERELMAAVALARAEGLDALVSERVLQRYASAVRTFVAAELALLQAYASEDDEGGMPYAEAESLRRGARITERLLLALRDRIMTCEVNGMLRPSGRPVRKISSYPPVAAGDEHD